MKTVTIIDDDITIVNMLEEILRSNGYNVFSATSGTEALELLSRQSSDIVLLDLMLPGLDGEEILPRIKGIPVIIISAKTDVRGKINLLMDGAADYITKPFDVGELLARIAVQLRRQDTDQSLLVSGDLSLDTLSHEVKAKGVPVKLTKTEYAILKQLMCNENQVVSKNDILEQISADTPDCTESSLKIHISNLRRKLRDVGGRDYIQAVWGIGFILTSE
ncbi:MAG: response regulator transcription factor [Oscillospiraceae bacterium]